MFIFNSSEMLIVNVSVFFDIKIVIIAISEFAPMLDWPLQDKPVYTQLTIIEMSWFYVDFYLSPKLFVIHANNYYIVDTQFCHGVSIWSEHH